MTKIFFCIHNMLLIQVQKTYHNTCTQLCVMAKVFTNTPEVTYRLILIVNNHWTECPIYIKSLKNLTSVNWIFAYRILIKNTKQKPDRPSHKPPSMCQLFGVLDWVQSIELEAPKRNRARPWHLIGQLINMEYGKMWQAVV